MLDVQGRYWQEFSDLKRDALYVARYHAHVENIDRALNIFAAIASSSAIAGWAIWREASLIWGFIIATSQVLTAVKPVLPYRNRMKALAGLSNDLDGLAITAETDWFKVSMGVLTAEEIHMLTMQLKRKKLAAQAKRFPEASLPERAKLLIRADADGKAYMSRVEGGADDGPDAELLS